MDKTRTVQVYAEPKASGVGYDIWLEEGNVKTDRLEFDKNKNGMKKKEKYIVEFHLNNSKDPTKSLRFSKDVKEVLWAKPVANISEKCPDSPCYMDGIFYVDPDVSNPIKDKKLSVINLDESIQTFKFALGFLPPGESDPPPSGYVRHDPIGENRNGGSPFIGSDVATWAVVGAGAAVLAFFAYRIWFE